MGKINPYKIVIGHWKTFGNPNGKGKWGDTVVFYGIPMVCGFAYFILCTLYPNQIRCVSENCWNSAMTVNSIFIPLVMTLMIGLYGISTSVSQKPQAGKLLRHLYCNASYLVLFSVLSLASIIAFIVVGCIETCWAAGLFVFAGMHSLLTILMILKRFHVLSIELTKNQLD